MRLACSLILCLSRPALSSGLAATPGLHTPFLPLPFPVGASLPCLRPRRGVGHDGERWDADMVIAGLPECGLQAASGPGSTARSRRSGLKAALRQSLPPLSHKVGPHPPAAGGPFSFPPGDVGVRWLDTAVLARPRRTRRQ